ncbi:Uncharacterised protein [Neisseria zoodegmatis]|uniref:Lipoprotein n=1 Tax=Neisseria zoodegmatis TaxID=326523 RepID=A0AB38DS66_9NEIS|nr:Uncharacterised protein [Neisseria zoodegmatis]
MNDQSEWYVSYLKPSFTRAVSAQSPTVMGLCCYQPRRNYTRETRKAICGFSVIWRKASTPYKSGVSFQYSPTAGTFKRSGCFYFYLYFITKGKLMFFKTCTAALTAAFLLSACAHRAPKPYGKPFPINAKQIADSTHKTLHHVSTHRAIL